MNGDELISLVEAKKQKFLSESIETFDAKFRSEIAQLTLYYLEAWESALERAKERQYDSYGTIRAIMELEDYEMMKIFWNSANNPFRVS